MTNIIIPIPRIKNLAECIVAKTEVVKPVCLNLVGKGEYTKFSNVEFALKEE